MMAILGAYQDWVTRLANPKNVINADGSLELSVVFTSGYLEPVVRDTLELCHIIKRSDGTEWRSDPVVAPYKVTSPPGFFDGTPLGHTVDIIYYLNPTLTPPGNVQATATAIQ